MSQVETSGNLEGQLLTVTKNISEIQIRSNERAKATHERFNIFTTILKETDEVRLHTRFLYSLLNPEGLHDCGSLFLNLFFETLNENPGVNDADEIVPFEIPSRRLQWKVQKEYPCPPNGQIDIFLESLGGTMAIENKVNSPEHKGQLADYACFLKERTKDKSHLIFLTKDGRKSVTSGGAKYVRISYANHILPWLAKCLRETYDLIPINQGLLQYRQVVRQITGETFESKDMKTIENMIKENTDVIRFRKQIKEAADQACTNFVKDLTEGIMKELRTKDGIISRIRGGAQLGDAGFDLILTLPATSILQDPFEVWINRDTEWECLCIWN